MIRSLLVQFLGFLFGLSTRFGQLDLLPGTALAVVCERRDSALRELVTLSCLMLEG